MNNVICNDLEEKQKDRGCTEWVRCLEQSYLNEFKASQFVLLIGRRYLSPSEMKIDTKTQEHCSVIVSLNVHRKYIVENVRHMQRLQ